MKHVTLWCYPRTGTTAYCEHLVNTKKVDSDELQEFLGKYRYWPCFNNDEVDLSTTHFHIDRTFKNRIDHTRGDPANFITEKLLRQYHNKEWVWVEYKHTSKGIKHFVTKDIPTQTKLDNHLQDTMNMLKETNISYVLKAYTYLNLDINQITYPTEHHLIIRDPLDTGLSQILANRTMIWHARKHDKVNFMNVGEIDFKEKQNLDEVEESCRQNINLLKMLEGRLDKFVRYEDLDLSSTSWKKLWTLEDKLSLCKNIHMLDDMLNQYKIALEKYL